MRSFTPYLLFAVLFATSGLPVQAQQWELTTPIKTRSEFTAIHLVTDAVGFAVDKPMGAILRTADGGYHWERMVNGLSNKPIGLFVWDDQRAIVVGESGSVYRTSDAFTSVESSNHPTYGHLNCVFFINDTLGWAGTQSGKVYHSTDAGENWSLMESGLGSNNSVTAIQFLDNDTGYLTCSGGGSVRKSTDGGLTWQDSGPGMVTTFRDLHFQDAQTGVCVGPQGYVVRTADGGTTWDSIPSNSNYVMNAVAAQGNVLVACGWWGRTIRSSDDGLSWTEVQTGNSEHRSVTLRPGGEGLLGTDGRILGTHDLGLSWALRHAGTWHTKLNKVSFMDADTGVAVGWQTSGGYESGLLRTTDGGRTWAKAGGGGLGVHLNAQGQGCLGGGSGSMARTTNGFLTRNGVNGPDVAIRCTWALNADTLFVAGGAVYGGIYRSTNHGATWTHVLDVGNITISDLWFSDALHGYAVGEYGDNYRSTDGGMTWDPMPDTPGGHTIFFLDTLHGWMKYRRTVDGGATWTDINSPQTTMSIFFTNPDTGYVVASSGQAEMSTDGGESWTTVLPDITNALIGDATYVDGAIVAVGRFGDIYRARVACPAQAAVPQVTQDGSTLCTTVGPGGTAQWYLDGLPFPGGDSVCINATEDGNYHVVVTDALGCVSAPSAPMQVVVSGVAGINDTSTRLFPNPAHEAVRIERQDNTPATLTITDVRGRTLRQEALSGTSVTVDLSGLRTGVYLLRITTAYNVETLRLVKK